MLTNSLILTLTLVLSSSLIGGVSSQSQQSGGCPANTNGPFNSSAAQSTPIQASLLTWQGIVLIICFGVFALLASLFFRLIRVCVYYDDHLLDTFFDAGGNINFALVACAVVARWLWTSSFTWSTASVREFGLAGHFWHAASGAVPILLFAIVAAEIRIKAPGAKTFLQVIRSRFGPVPHIVVMVFALLINVIIGGMIMMEGTRILTALCSGVSKEVILVVLTGAVGVATVVGGVGGALYMTFFATALVVSLMLVYFTDTFFNPRGILVPFPGGIQNVFDEVCSVQGPAENSQASVLTFMSRGAMLDGIVIVLSGFSSVFVDQSSWSVAVSAKPIHAVWGYLTAGLAWFGIPFMLSFTFGITYWALSAEMGYPIVTESQALLGYLPVVMSQQLLGQAGDFMMYSLTLAVVITGVGSEILSIASIIIYDIYQTYISPFGPSDVIGQGPYEQRKFVGDEFIAFNKRCCFIKYVVVAIVAILLYPLTIILLAIGIDLPWLFMALGVVCGSSVIPIVFSVTWHRTTGPGVTCGVLVGAACGIVAWLVYASTFPNGLTWFRGNTGRPEVFITGTSVSLGVGGLVCLFVSLACGGCDPHCQEEQEWERCRKIDNPMMPWTVRYAPNMCSTVETLKLGGSPQLSDLRATFRYAEWAAYGISIILSIAIIFVWPALMLLAGVFDYQTFYNWTYLVLIWGCCSAIFLCIFPLLYEFSSICCQASTNRAWIQADRRTERGGDVSGGCGTATMSTFVQPVKLAGGVDYATNCSTVQCGGVASGGSLHYGNIGSVYGRAGPIAQNGRTNAERWQTYIHLD